MKLSLFADQFQHTDGTPVDYVNWANGEPSGAVAGVAQDCVELYPDSYGKWNDEDCTATAGYVCKKPKSKHIMVYMTNTSQMLTVSKYFLFFLKMFID